MISCVRMVLRQITNNKVLNLVNIAYSAMKILPYHYDCWNDFQKHSPQELRFAISEQIRKQVFLTTLSEIAKTIRKSSGFLNTLIRLVEKFGLAT